MYRSLGRSHHSRMLAGIMHITCMHGRHSRPGAGIDSQHRTIPSHHFSFQGSAAVHNYYLENSRKKQFLSFKLRATRSSVAESHPAWGGSRPSPSRPVPGVLPARESLRSHLGCRGVSPGHRVILITLHSARVVVLAAEIHPRCKVLPLSKRC